MDNKMRRMSKEESETYQKGINELFKPTGRNIFDDTLFGLTEIQYIRGLVMADKMINNYEKEGMKAKIDQKTSMHDFTEEILNKLDRLEN